MQLANHTRTSAIAFTLIELLVVITIIVVLLALLVPAMDKAIYRAELTVCGSQLRGIGTGVSVYASENKRSFPDRSLSGGEPHNYDQAAELKYHPATTQRPVDQRIVLKNALPALSKQLNDPLAGDVDIEDPNASIVFSPYNLWFDFKHTNGTAMTKMGQRWRYGNETFDVLAGDRDQVRPAASSGAEAQSSHSDGHYEGGILSQLELRNETSPWLITSGTTVVLAMWYSGEGGGAGRGLTDDNFVMTDLSVKTIDKVHWNHDERVREVPVFSGSDGPPGQYMYVP